MSTTVYQTTAKPRGRKDLEGISVELEGTSSRAPSQASQRMSKMVSRTLEDSQTAKSRPRSPAYLWQRNKAIDPPAVERGVITSSADPNKVEESLSPSRPLSASLTSSRPAAEGISIPGAFPTNTCDQQRITVHPPSTLARVMSQSHSKTRRSPSRSRTRSLTQSSIARMQPTAVDAPDDETSYATTTTKSSTTSLDLKSGQGSDVVVGVTETGPIPPPPEQSSHSPPKFAVIDPTIPFASTSESVGLSSPWRSSSHGSGSHPHPSTPQHVYQPPPSSFPNASPRQSAADGAHLVQQATPSATISPPHSPLLTHQSMYNTPFTASYVYGYPPQTAAGQMITSHYYGDMQQMPSPPLTSTCDESLKTLNPIGGDENQRDWAKLTSVLPELNRLLSKYEDQKGQSSSRDSFAKQMDHHRSQEMASLRVELEANKSEYEKVIRKLVTESFELKREIETRDKTLESMQGTVSDLKGQQEKNIAAHSRHQETSMQHRALQEKYDALENQYQKTTTELRGLEVAHEQLQKKHEDTLSDAKFYRIESTSWKSRYHEAAGVSDQARLAKEDLVACKMRLEASLEDLRRKSQAREEKHQADTKALRKDYEAVLEAKDKERSNLSSDHKAALGSVQLELAGMIDRHNRQRKDLDTSRSQVISLEKKLEAKSRDREEQSARHRQQLDAKSKEMEDLANSHRRQLESQMASLTAQRQKDLDGLKKDHEKAMHDLRKSHDAKSARLSDDHATELRKVHGDLNAQRAIHEAYTRETESLRARHGELATVMTSWKQRQEEWQAEQSKLNKIMEALSPGRKEGDTKYQRD